MSEFSEKRLIGLSLDKAKVYANQNDYVIRVVKNDDEIIPITAEYCSDRINVFVRKGKINWVHSWG